MPDSPISYALPTRENLDSDEDWSRISDRKMKKRVQNRVAQREYRRRTRERIEELTAELNKYRRHAPDPNADGRTQEEAFGGDANRSSSPREENQQSQIQQPPQQSPQQSSQQRFPQPSPPQMELQGQSLVHQQQQPRTRCEQQQKPESQQRKSPPSHFQQAPQMPPQHQIHHLQTHPQLQPHEKQHQQQLPDLLALANACGHTSTSLFPSLLQPSTPSTVPLSVIQPELWIPNPAIKRGHAPEIPDMAHSASSNGDQPRIAAPEALDRVYYGKNDSAFRPIEMDEEMDDGEHGDDLDGEKDSGNNNFFDVTDGMSTLLAEQSPPLTQTHPPDGCDPRGQMPQSHTDRRTRSNRSSGSRHWSEVWDFLPGSDTSLEQRFDFLFDWVQHAGFGSLDRLLEMWYTGTISESSPLRQEQRLSRHRGLTALLAKLRVATHWSKWERWGYQEETLLGAESILRAEFSALMPCAQLGRHIAALEACHDQDKPEMAKLLKRCLQNELPQLRTLLTAVTADSGKVGRYANRKAIDTATLVLGMAGRVPDSHLLALVKDGLQQGNRSRESARAP